MFYMIRNTNLQFNFSNTTRSYKSVNYLNVCDLTNKLSGRHRVILSDFNGEANAYTSYQLNGETLKTYQQS